MEGNERMNNISISGPTGLFMLLIRWVSLLIPLRQFSGLVYLPRYLAHWWKYAAKSSKQLRFRDSYPCLTDWVSSTPFDPHYFYQGAWLARKIAQAKPAQHVDIGSSVLTVSVLSATVDTIFVDYRPLEVNISNLTCIAGSITDLPFSNQSVHSLSSMHVLEHIGLGRYGDPIDPNGSAKAAVELARVVAPMGKLYLTAPVGRSRVCFNAHRIFDPNELVAMFEGLSLISFSWVDDSGILHENTNLNGAVNAEYACGFFEFERLSCLEVTHGNY